MWCVWIFSLSDTVYSTEWMAGIPRITFFKIPSYHADNKAIHRRKNMWTIIVTLYAVALSALWGFVVYKEAKKAGDTKAVLVGSLSGVFAVPTLIWKAFLEKTS
jgi:TctA family transporter